MGIVSDIAIIATPVIILVGFMFTYKHLQASRNTRLAEVILSLTIQWDGTLVEEGRSKVDECGNESKVKARIEEEAKNPNRTELHKLVRVANFFDSLGALVAEGLVDCRVAYKLFGRPEDHYYNLYRSILEDTAYKDYFKCFIELHEAFTKEEAKLSRGKFRPFR